MQRTFNYTGRQRIEKKHALFSFPENSKSAPEFEVEFASELLEDFPPDASLYVEAHFRETRQRFDFGTVGNVSAPEDRCLDKIDLSGPTLFRVLIVDHTGRQGLILGSGDHFRADAGDDENNRTWLLSVSARPIGQLPWKVEFQTGGMPELTINKSIPGAIERLRSDLVFQSLVLPAALREILIHYLVIDHDDSSEIWEQWNSFASRYAEAVPTGGDASDQLEWVDEVVAGFCAQFGFSDMLVNSGIGDTE